MTTQIFRLTSLLVALTAARAFAAENVWTNDSGNGLWDTTSANWTAPAVWNNSAGDIAVFGEGEAGAISLGLFPTYIGGMRFESPGYSIGFPGSFQILAGADATIQTEADATVAALFTGPGTLEKTGEGMLTLLGMSTHTGGTLVSEGTLRIGNGGNTGSLIGLITNNAEVVFDRGAGFVDFNGTIIGSGHVTKLGTGSLSGNFYHTGGTTVSEGSLRIPLGVGRSDNSGDIVNNALVLISTLGISQGVYSGNMSGSGSFSKLPETTATLVFTGSNTYTGGTRVMGGTLQLGDGGTTGSITGDVAIDSNGALAFNRSNDMVFAGIISGGGRLNKLGDGVTALSGANTYTGGTTISAGTLSIGTGGASGSITGNVLNNATLAFNRSDSNTYPAVISGSGRVVKSGAGTLALTGANTYTGGTTIAGGTLSIGNGGSSGSITGYVANNGTLDFNRQGDDGFSGVVAGAGNVIISGSGRTTLTGAFTHTGGTTVNAGILQVGSSFSPGHLGGNVLNNASVVFGHGEAFVTYAGNMSGTGSLSKSGNNGQLTLTGTNTYTGGTVISSGKLQIGDGGTTGSIAGSINLGSAATLVFHRSDNQTFGGSVAGGGGIHKLGGNTLTLTGSHTSTGAATVFDGTLAIGDGVIGGQFGGNIVNNAAVQFNVAEETIYTRAISGVGTLTKAGPGALRLRGSNTFTGTTTVTGGTLWIEPSSSPTGFVSSIVNNAAVAFNRNGMTYGGNISGSGSVTVAAGLSITGNWNHAGGTTVTGGVFSIGSVLAPGGSIEGDIANNAHVQFSRPGDILYSHKISGTGQVSKFGRGVLTLTGANTFAGTMFVSEGGLQLGDGGAAGSVAGDVSLTTSTRLIFNRSDDLVFGGAITGNGGLEKLGTNQLTLTGANSNLSYIIIGGGKLVVGDGGTNGRIGGSVTNHGQLVFNRSDDWTFNGGVTGSGSVIKRGAGALAFTGSIAPAGGTTVEEGTLRLQSGTLSGNVINNAAIEATNFFLLPANISGSGTFTKRSPAALTLTGTNTYTGGTSIVGGTLRVGDQGTTGSVVGNVNTGNAVDGTGTLAFNRSDAIQFDGVVSGAGRLQKAGANTLRLTAAHTHTGATEIAGGTLKLVGDASISDSSSVETRVNATLDVTELTGGSNYENGRFALAAGQALGGIGHVAGDVTVRAGARVAPGLTTPFPIRSTLQVAGNVAFQPGSSFDVQGLFPEGLKPLAASGEITFAGDVDNPFTINLANQGTVAGDPGAFVIASGSLIGSSGLDSPLSVEVGEDGAGVATNADHIRLSVTGFAMGSVFSLQRVDNELRLQYVSPVAADFNDDGVVNSHDLARWTASAGLATGATNEQGDADADGDVDGADFLTWQRQLGSSLTTPAAAVPEPRSLPLALAMGLAALMISRVVPAGGCTSRR